MSALSDSTTTTASPLLMASPSPLSQETILPSVIVDESAGMWISFTSALTATDRGAERTDRAGASDLREPAKEEREPASAAGADRAAALAAIGARGGGAKEQRREGADDEASAGSHRRRLEGDSAGGEVARTRAFAWRLARGSGGRASPRAIDTHDTRDKHGRPSTSQHAVIRILTNQVRGRCAFP